MFFLDYAKQYHNFDVFLVLLDDAGYTDEEITTKFDVSKQRIYDARKRLETVIESLKDAEPYKRDMRDKNILIISEAFQKAFGTTKVTNFDRYAAKRLYLKHTTDAIVAIINALAAHAGEEFCPIVNSITAIENKLPSIIAFLKKQQNISTMVEL